MEGHVCEKLLSELCSIFVEAPWQNPGTILPSSLNNFTNQKHKVIAVGDFYSVWGGQVKYAIHSGTENLANNEALLWTQNNVLLF